MWPGQDPIGKRFSRGFGEEQGFEVVGVVTDARVTSIERTPPLMVYVPCWWRSRASLTLIVKTAADPSSLVPSIRRSVRPVDPGHRDRRGSSTLEQLVDASLAARRYQMRLFVVFGAVALFIATLGVYAVTAFGVPRRRREMNIRVALGAQASQVRRMIVGQGLSPVALGVAVGVAGALAVGRVIAGLLFDVGARDPLAIAGVAALVSVAGVVASAVAARQGISIDPAAALRDE
jgi:ABC-type antimicrobial peptide transport system permease subunit